MRPFRCKGLSLFVGSLALATAASAQGNPAVPDAEVLFVGPDLTTINATFAELMRVRAVDGTVIIPESRGERLLFNDVGQKLRIEFTTRGLKTPYVDVVMQPGAHVYLTVCVNPLTGEVKEIQQKVKGKKSKLTRRRMGRGAPQLLGAANDECVGATSLPCDGVAVVADNTSATTAVDDPDFSCIFLGPGQGVGTLWYSFVATGDAVHIDTEGSAAPADDSVIALYEGACGALTELGCSEDEGTGLLSTLDVGGLTVGNTYFIQLASFSAADQGAYNLTVECMGGMGGGGNDECAGAEELTCGTSVTADNSLATTAVDDPDFSCIFGGPGQGAGSIWYTFVATGDSVTIDTEGSVSPADDSVLAVYDGTCGALTELGCSEDEGTGLLSDLTVSGLTVGNTYYVQLASFSAGDQGAYNLNIECFTAGGPANDECANAEDLPCNSSATADNTFATTAVDDPEFSCFFGGSAQGVGTLWYSFVATDTSASIDTNMSPTATDTLLAVYDGSCGAFTELACSEDEGDGLLSQLDVVGLTVGNTYYIQVATFSDAARGEITTNLVCPADIAINDECDDALPLMVPSTFIVDTSNASSDIADGCDTLNPENNVWYTVTGTGNTMTISTCNAGSIENDSIINVFCGECDELVCVAGNDDDCDLGDGFLSTVSWCSQPGVEYLVTIGGFGTADAGIFEVTVSDDGDPNCDVAVNCLPVGACCLKDGTCAILTAEDCADAAGIYQGDDTECGANVVADGSFEGGSPSASWTEFSAIFGSPLCTTALCGTGGGTGPNTGDWWCWFGGIAAPEMGSVSQMVTIPAGATTLDFALEIPAASGNGTDFMEVRVDGMVVGAFSEADGPFVGYTGVSLDISGFADGGMHLLEFVSEVSGVGGVTNFFVDDIAISSTTLECASCSTIDFEGITNGRAIGVVDGVSFAGVGLNTFGTAIFDTDSAGPNAGGPDPDLLVDTGNCVILQETQQQSIPGIYDVPNDATFGGDMHIVFPGPTSVRCLDLIDVDTPGPDENITVILTDAGGAQRTYFVPASWTGDISTDGPPGFGTLNVITSNDQPGFASTAVLIGSGAGYDNEAVVSIELVMGSSAGVDNIVYCD